MEAILNSGYWSEFERFKNSLAYTVDNYGKGQVALWDFALYSDYTVTPVPQKNDDETFYWFWEPAHYKAELGESLLSNMFQGKCTKESHQQQLGVDLIHVNITEHLKTQKERRSFLIKKPQ